MTGYGKPAGLRSRLATWADRLGRDKTLPWIGMGLIRDLEIAVQLLNLQEFAEWLRVNGPPEHRAFADDILGDQFTLEAVRDAIGQSCLSYMPTDPVRGVELLDAKARGDEADAIRQVLIDAGALSPDDFETNLPDLVRALLS